VTVTEAVASNRLGRTLLRRFPAPRNGAVVTAVIAAIAVGAVAEGSLWAHHPLLTTVNLLASAGLVGIGSWLVTQPGQRGTGWALILSGVARPLGWLDSWPSGPWPLYSVVFGYADSVFAAWALLRYPDPRLSRPVRWYLGVLAGWLICVPAVLVAVARPGWMVPRVDASTWWLPSAADPRVFADVSNIFLVGCTLLTVAFLALMVRRMVTGSRQERAVRLPVAAAAIVAAVASVVVVTVTTLQGPNDEVFAIEGMAELSVPIAFLVSFGQQRLTRLSGLVAGFDETTSTVRLLRDVLRARLRAPELELAVWSEADGQYMTVDGYPADLDSFAAGSVVERVMASDGRPLALLAAGAWAGRDRTIINSAVAMSRLALEKFQLSRRLLTAEYDARQKLVADLHDGAQLELYVLMAILSQADNPDPDVRAEALATARHQLEAAIEQLGELAHGVYPVTLTHAGLGKAVQETADRLDELVRVAIPADRLPAAVEKTVYFLIREALTNAHKHAGAETIDVIVAREGDHVTICVRDDGRGGVDPQGTGLATLRDRIAAHGGQMNVDSHSGHGTRITARIPCV
jgi:signal transduction histidine kinase